jgi:ATP-binding cassette ChvD family protein
MSTVETERVIFSMLGVRKSYGRQLVIKDISLSYYLGAKIGVLGANGSGKSSLLRIMAGLDKAFEGQLASAPGITFGYLEQEPLAGETRTVREIVEDGAATTIALLREYDAISERFGEPMEPEEMEKLLERQGAVQERLERAGGWELDAQLEMAMDALRCPPPDMRADVISGGEKRRVALCRLLIQKPDVLLLDEPTNHLDAESIAWLEEHLRRYPGTVIAVTHDRYFLDEVAGWILELDRGEGVPWKGNYSSWLEQKEERLRKEEKEASKRRRTLQRELEWIRNTKRSRQTQNKARMRSYESLLAEDPKEREREREIYVPPGPRLGDLVIEAKKVSKAYGDRLLIDDLSFRLPPGGIVGVIGPNGAGKTTLFRMITGAEAPDEGEIRVGDSVVLACAGQDRGDLPAGATAWEAVSDGADEIELGSVKVNSRAYMARFGFTGSEQQRRVEALSGGERNRVHLARALKAGANVLLLDEPTNDLDVATLRALEEGLLGFAGCAVIISHDRWFLDRVATHILAFEGDSTVRFFPGNYSDYEADRHARLGAEADRPHRIAYRKLTRRA